jgi:putative PIN family toxin of toxin-antitoxin system
MKIVVDTNCLLRILPKNSNYRSLWNAFLSGGFKLCYTTEILQEYEEVLSRFYSATFAKFVIDTILNSSQTERVTVYYKWLLIIDDPDDNKFVDCAISANADFIVTNDKHFNKLNNLAFPKIKVIDIDVFKQVFTH